MLGVGGEVWNWRRMLLAWEEEQVGGCSKILTSIVLHDGLDVVEEIKSVKILHCKRFLSINFLY